MSCVKLGHSGEWGSTGGLSRWPKNGVQRKDYNGSNREAERPRLESRPNFRREDRARTKLGRQITQQKPAAGRESQWVTFKIG